MKNILITFLFVSANVLATDWPQYRGANLDGSTIEQIAQAWPQDGPRVVWKADLGPSFGSFAVSGGTAFCFIQRKVDGEDREVAIALDASTGRELWAVTLGKPTYDRQGGDGPRSTPTVDDGRVYFLGAYQILTCLDAKSGKQLWQHDLVKDFGGRVIKWNNAASPVLDGGLIFVNAGGQGQAMIAFDKVTGKVVWKGQDDLPTHATPTIATIHGVRQVIFLTQTGLASLAPDDGRVLWRHDYKFQTSTASSPVVSKDIVYCSAAYNVGAGAVRVTKDGANFTATELWRKPGDLMNHWTTPVCKDGYLYGIFGTGKTAGAPLKCIEIATGREMWSRDGFGGGGATILVGGNVLAQCDRGPLVLVEATPKEYHELTRCQPFGGQCWTMAVVSGGKIFARNTAQGVCMDVAPRN